MSATDSDQTDEQTIDQIREDPKLNPMEKETHIRFARDQDLAHVFTEESGVARRLHAHPEADVSPVRRVDGDPVGARGTIPIGCVGVTLEPRKSDGHADVVTHRALDHVETATGNAEENPDDSEGQPSSRPENRLTAPQ
jgi:hypothetical protein